MHLLFFVRRLYRRWIRRATFVLFYYIFLLLYLFLFVFFKTIFWCCECRICGHRWVQVKTTTTAAASNRYKGTQYDRQWIYWVWCCINNTILVILQYIHVSALHTLTLILLLLLYHVAVLSVWTQHTIEYQAISRDQRDDDDGEAKKKS